MCICIKSFICNMGKKDADKESIEINHLKSKYLSFNHCFGFSTSLKLM